MDFEFYDTNVLIFLLDRYSADKAKAAEFLSSRKILITNYVMGEIRNSSSRNRELIEIVDKYDFYFVNPDNIVNQEIENYLSQDRKSLFNPRRCNSWLLNFLENELPPELPNAAEAKAGMYKNYEKKLNAEIGTMHDERRLRASITVRINEHASLVGREIPLPDTTYRFFPSVFVFQYLWWLRFSRQPDASSIEANDLYDLLNASVAPYSKVWVGERSIAGTLRQITGRAIPSIRSSLKYLLEKGEISRSTFESLDTLGGKIRLKESLLPDTRVMNFSEFAEYYAKWSG